MSAHLLAIQDKITEFLVKKCITEEMCMDGILKILKDYHISSEPKPMLMILDGDVIMNDELRRSLHEEYLIQKNFKLNIKPDVK
jgi:hypothetical protein